MLSIAILMLSPPPAPPLSVRAGLQQPAQHDCPGSCHKAGGSQADVFQRLGSPHFLMFSAVWRLDSHATGRTMSTFSIYSPGVSDAVSYGPQATASGARCPRQAFSLHLRARRALRRRRQLLQGRAEGVPCSAADQVQEREGRGVVARAPGAQFPNLEVMARLSTSAALRPRQQSSACSPRLVWRSPTSGRAQRQRRSRTSRSRKPICPVKRYC